MAQAEMSNALKALFTASSVLNLDGYGFERQLQDADGVFQRIVFYRRNGTKIAQSDLSNKQDGTYRKETIQYFDDAGVQVTETVRWTLGYNANKELISRLYSAT